MATGGIVPGLQWHYDVTGAEPILRDLRVYNGGAILYEGTAMAAGPVATAENAGAAIKADGNVLSNIIGVLNEEVAAANVSVVATGVDYYGKIIINPMAVWLGRYSFHADDDEVTNSADPKVYTQTMVTDHERCWVYVTSTGSSSGGFGNLFQAGAAGTTATLTAATSYDDNMTATTNGTDTVIVMPAPYYVDVAGGGVELSEAASGYGSRTIAGYETTAAAGSGIILENYIASKVRPMEPLVCSRHSGYNYKSENPWFLGDLMFTEHCLCAGAVVNNRVIT